MCITGYGTMENPIHSLWKSKNSFPTSCKWGFPQFHERIQLYDISTMPAPTESISSEYTDHVPNLFLLPVKHLPICFYTANSTACSTHHRLSSGWFLHRYQDWPYHAYGHSLILFSKYNAWHLVWIIALTQCPIVNHLFLRSSVIRSHPCPHMH